MITEQGHTLKSLARIVYFTKADVRRSTVKLFDISIAYDPAVYDSRNEAEAKWWEANQKMTHEDNLRRDKIMLRNQTFKRR